MLIRARSGHLSLLYLVIVALILSAGGVGLSGSAASAPAPKVEYVTSLGGSMTSVAISGAIAYTGQGGSLAIYEISDPSAIVPLSRIRLPAFVERIQLVHPFVYVADGMGGLQIIDVRDPLIPVLVGSLSTTGVFYDLAVVGDTAYVTETMVEAPFATWLRVIDVRNPAAPTLLGSYTVGEFGIGSIDVVDGMAYLAHALGLTMIDVSDPAQPQLVGSYVNPVGAVDVAVAGGLAVLAAQSMTQLLVVDVSTPASPALLANYGDLAISDLYARVQIVGEIVYAVGPATMDVIDLAQPAAPVRMGTYAFSGADLQIVGARAFLVARSDGLFVVDISAQPSPLVLGRYSLFGTVRDIAAQPPLLFATEGVRKLQILNITQPGAPLLLTTSSPLGISSQLVVRGTTAYLNGPYDRFEILDASNPAQPVLSSSYSPHPNPYSAMTVSGTYAFLGGSDSQSLESIVYVVDVRDPTAPTAVGSVQFSGSSPQAMQVQGSLLYVAAGAGGLVIIDLTDPAQPVVIGRYATLWAGGIDIVGERAYVSDPTAGLSILDISNPAAPTWIGQYATSDTMLADVEVVDGRAFIADHRHGLLIVDVADALNPALFDRYEINGGVWGVEIAGSYIYLACPQAGLQVLRLVDPVPSTPTQSPTPMIPPTPSATPVLGMGGDAVHLPLVIR
jgi:hypothetical protein